MDFLPLGLYFVPHVPYPSVCQKSYLKTSKIFEQNLLLLVKTHFIGYHLLMMYIIENFLSMQKDLPIELPLQKTFGALNRSS